jgi:hypothetical protein
MPRLGRRVAAIVTGGSLSGMVLVHVVHLASVAAAPAAFTFLCQLGR